MGCVDFSLETGNPFKISVNEGFVSGQVLGEKKQFIFLTSSRIGGGGGGGGDR